MELFSFVDLAIAMTHIPASQLILSTLYAYYSFGLMPHYSKMPRGTLYSYGSGLDGLWYTITDFVSTFFYMICYRNYSRNSTPAIPPTAPIPSTVLYGISFKFSEQQMLVSTITNVSTVNLNKRQIK